MGGFTDIENDAASTHRVPVPPPERDPLVTHSARGLVRHGSGVFFFKHELVRKVRVREEPVQE